MKEKKGCQTPSPFVTVICYRTKKEWNREEAIAFYANGVLECDGSEKNRYADILAQLCLGHNTCSDGSEVPE